MAQRDCWATLNTQFMNKSLVIGIVCIVILGCQTTHYSTDHRQLHDAKFKLSQLREGMKREEVEAILKPLPDQLPFDWKFQVIR